MDKLSRSASHQNNLFLPSTLHINTRYLLLILASHLIHLSLSHIGWVHIFGSLSLHMCKRKALFSSFQVDQIWPKFQEAKISGDWNFRKLTFPTLTQFVFGFVRETFFWIGCCFGHKNQGILNPAFTSTGCPNSGCCIDFCWPELTGYLQNISQCIILLLEAELTKVDRAILQVNFLHIDQCLLFG